MLNNLENIHTFVLSLLSVPALLIIFRIDNWYKTERTDHGGGGGLGAHNHKQCLVFSLFNNHYNSMM